MLPTAAICRGLATVRRKTYTRRDLKKLHGGDLNHDDLLLMRYR
jgi:hypothetical protein